MWEYAGSIRFDLLTESFKPFVKLGYGWVWYRVTNIRLDGQPVGVEGNWVRKPSFFPFHDLFPTRGIGGSA